MFDKFKNINFSKTYIEVSEIDLDIDLSQLENDIISTLLSYDSSFNFCEEEMSEVVFSFNCMYVPVDDDNVSEFIVAEVTMGLYDAKLDIEEEDLSFELTYPSTLTYDELLNAYKLLIGNIFSVIKAE